MDKDIEILISSPYEYDQLCAEIEYKGHYVAMLAKANDTGEYVLEFPGCVQHVARPSLIVPLSSFEGALSQAKEMLG